MSRRTVFAVVTNDTRQLLWSHATASLSYLLLLVQALSGYMHSPSISQSHSFSFGFRTNWRLGISLRWQVIGKAVGSSNCEIGSRWLRKKPKGM